MKHIMLILALGACGKDDTKSEPAAPSSIVGSYKSDCFSVGSGWYTVVSTANTDTTSVINAEMFYDSACATLKFTDIASRTYTVLGASTVPGAYFIDFTLIKSERVLKDAGSVTDSNKTKAYGYSNWAADVAKDTTGLPMTATGVPNTAKGTLSHGIFKLVGSSYIPGDGDSLTALSTTISLKKQ